MILSISMVIPMAIDLHYDNSDWKTFGVCIIFTLFFGSALALSNLHKLEALSLRQTFILTVIIWPILTIFSALPFTLSTLDLSFTDSFFEAMSGITTTGATIIPVVENAPPGILIWRALLQWMGGIGMILMALSIFPHLRVGGMQIFKSQAAHTDNISIRLMKMCTTIGTFYAAITALCLGGYVLGGMSLFDAFAHALSTVSSGGFSTHTQSFQFFEGKPVIEFTAILFMLLSGLPLFTIIRGLIHDRSIITKDPQIKTYLSIIAASAILIAIFFIKTEHLPLSTAINKAIFNTVSMITGTGFTNTGPAVWNGFALSIIFFLMMAGGCAGSTTSGLKAFRLNALFEVSKSQIRSLIHPSGVFTPRYGNKALTQDTILSILSYFFAFTILLAAITLLLSFYDLDITTSLSAAVSAISNVGPGFGPIIGVESTYATLASPAKWILSFCMLLGRLEIFTILVLFSPYFWKR